MGDGTQKAHYEQYPDDPVLKHKNNKVGELWRDKHAERCGTCYMYGIVSRPHPRFIMPWTEMHCEEMRMILLLRHSHAELSGEP